MPSIAGSANAACKIIQPILHRTRIVERPAIQRMRAQNSLIPKRLQMRDARDPPVQASACSPEKHCQRGATQQRRRLHHRIRRARHSAETSPTQMISAGPVSSITASLLGHTVRCAPPSAIAVSSRSTLRNAIAAAEDAQVPVPDEVVGPHPRSKIRNAISDGDNTRTNSTFVPCGNSGLVLICRPKLLPRQSLRTEILRLDENNKVRIPHIHHRSGNIAHAGHLNRARHHAWNPHLALDQVHRIGSLHHAAGAQPPCVPKATSVLPSLLASHAATQRVPLPESSASLPSALNSRRKNSPFGLTLQKLDSIGAHAGVPRAELPRKFSMAALRQRLFNNQENHCRRHALLQKES